MLLIETERLRLAHLDARDAELILELLNTAAFIRNIGDRGVRTLDDAREYIETGPIASYQQHGFGLNRVSLREGGATIGICGLLKRAHLEHPDIGFALLPRYWSCGYAREAAAAVIADGQQTHGLNKLLAITALENPDSIRLLEKLGFVFQGLMQAPVTDETLRLFARDSDSLHADPIAPSDHIREAAR